VFLDSDGSYKDICICENSYNFTLNIYLYKCSWIRFIKNKI
jgi:hypothetical protein